MQVQWLFVRHLAAHDLSTAVGDSRRILLEPTNPICPYHVYAYNRANTRRSVLKRLDFSQLWLSKRAVHFLPHESISFCWKKSSSEIPKFLTLTNWVKRLLTNKTSQKSNIIFKRSSLGVQISWIPLDIWKVISKKNWNPNTTKPQDIWGTPSPPLVPGYAKIGWGK